MSCRIPVDIKILEWTFYLAVLILLIIGIYFDMRYCGGFSGTIEDVPRWCWYLR